MNKITFQDYKNNLIAFEEALEALPSNKKGSCEQNRDVRSAASKIINSPALTFNVRRMVEADECYQELATIQKRLKKLFEQKQKGLERRWYHFSDNKTKNSSIAAIENIAKRKIQDHFEEYSKRLLELGLEMKRLDLPVERKSAFARNFLEVYAQLINGNHVAEGEEKILIRQAQKIITDVIKAAHRDLIQNVLHQVPRSQRIEFEEHLDRYLKGLGVSFLSNLLYTVTTVPSGRELDVLKMVMRVDKDVATRNDLDTSILQAILYDYRISELHDLDLTFFRDVYGIDDLLKVAPLLLKFPKEHRQAALDFVKRYCANDDVDVYVNEIVKLLNSLKEIPPDLWVFGYEKAKEVVSALRTSFSIEELKYFMKAFIGLSETDKMSLVEDIKFLGKWGYLSSFGEATSLLALIPTDKRRELFAQYKKILPAIGGYGERRAKFLNLIYVLHKNGKSELEIKFIVPFLVRFSSSLQDSCKDQNVQKIFDSYQALVRLFQKNRLIYGFDWFDVDELRHMFRILIQIPDDERRLRANRVLERLEVEPKLLHRRLYSMLETPFYQDLTDADGQVPKINYAAGVDVHNRDDKLKSAWELLRATQNAISDKDRDDAIKAFEDYLNSCKDESKKNKARRAYDGEATNEFPSLIDDSRGEFTIAGLKITGKEVIARLWKFTEGLSDKKDQEIARSSMITALTNCFNFDDRRICNPGKVQHLVIAVLQGRLKGMVPLDDVPLEEKGDAPLTIMKTYDAVNMFFASEQNQELLDDEIEMEHLLQVAGKFADQGRRVTRKEFLNDVEKTKEPSELTRVEKWLLAQLAAIAQLLQKIETNRIKIQRELDARRNPETLLVEQEDLRNQLRLLEDCPIELILKHYTRQYNELHPERSPAPQNLLAHFGLNANLNRIDLIKRLEYFVVEREKEPLRRFISYVNSWLRPPSEWIRSSGV